MCSCFLHSIMCHTCFLNCVGIRLSYIVSWALFRYLVCPLKWAPIVLPYAPLEFTSACLPSLNIKMFFFAALRTPGNLYSSSFSVFLSLAWPSMSTFAKDISRLLSRHVWPISCSLVCDSVLPAPIPLMFQPWYAVFCNKEFPRLSLLSKFYLASVMSRLCLYSHHFCFRLRRANSLAFPPSSYVCLLESL